MMGVAGRIGVLTFVAFLMQGCASSSMTHSVDEQAQAAYASGNSAVGDVGGINPGRSWQGSSQAAKGAVIGGLTGGVVGGMVSGLGMFPAVLGGAVFGGALGTWVDDNTSSSDRLLNRGGNVMVLGDQIRVVLLSADVFEMDSANISPHAYKTLDSVVQLIGRYPNRRVTVAAYSDPGDAEKTGVAFTTAEADSVVRYLWRAGVNTRLLYAVGYAGRYPVARPGGNHPGDNRRIEVTLEKLPV